MMKLVSEYLEKEIEFKEGKVNLLEINNRELFNKFIYVLNKNININDYLEGVFLYEDSKEISLNKNCIMIYDFYNIAANQSKILKHLYDNIEKEYKLIYDSSEIMKMQKALLESIRDIIIEYDYELKQKENLEIKDILKILDLKFDSDYYDKPLENIYLIIELMEAFKIYKVIVLINVKCYLSKEEVKELYKMINYKRINALFIEYYKDEVIDENERKIMIDNDYDEIYIN